MAIRPQLLRAVSKAVLAHAALALSLCVATAAPARAEPESCWDDWAAAAEVVQLEHLATVAELAERVRQHMRGKVLRTRLCEENGLFTYRLVVRSPQGVLQPLAVDARGPFGQAVENHD